MLRSHKHCYALRVLPSMLLSIALLSSVILSSSYSYADSVTSNATVIVPASCNLSSTLDTAHTATINPGQSQSDIGTTTFKVICNDNSGFSLYAIGYSNEEYGNTKLLATINSQLSPANDIITGTATSGSVSNWAMKLTPVSGTYAPTIASDTNGSFASYHIVPETYTKVATFLSSTDASIGSSVQSTYRAYITSTQPAGTYAGKVRYTLVHPASEVPAQPQITQSGKICYYANASDAVGTMGCRNVAASVTLLASNFSRTGYGFAGWSDAFDYATNQNAHFYGPNEDITLTPADYQSPNNGLSLYAVWIESAGSLQDTTKVATLCGTGTGSLVTAPTNGTANLSSVSALTDLRDNQTYAIAKLADGNCWMIENLRLESTNSDNSTGTLAQGYGTSATYGNFSGLADAETADKFSSTYSANSLYSINGANNTIYIGTSNTAYRMPRYSNVNTSARASSPTTNYVAMYSYGNYYTWHAAIADLTPSDANDNFSANTSICPAGWHLPKGGNKSNEANNEFWSLVVTGVNGSVAPANYSSSTIPYYTGTAEAGPVANKLRSYPNNFVYSGYVYSDSVSSRGSGGNFWSSTARSSTYAFDLNLDSSRVYPGTNFSSKYSGGSVRCIASGA